MTGEPSQEALELLAEAIGISSERLKSHMAAWPSDDGNLFTYGTVNIASALRAIDKALSSPQPSQDECARCRGMRAPLARGREPEELCDPCYDDETASLTPPAAPERDVVVERLIRIREIARRLQRLQGSIWHPTQEICDEVEASLTSLKGDAQPTPASPHPIPGVEEPVIRLSLDEQCRLFGSDLVDLLRREGRYSGVWFADRLLKSADIIEQQQARIEDLRGALAKAAQWFEDYAAEHYAKARTATDGREQHGREVKGKLNRDRANELRQLLSSFSKEGG